MKTFVVVRHAGAVEWLNKHHPEFQDVEVVSHATSEILVGNRIIGVLPIHLAALCGEYWHLEMTIPPEARGKELTSEDMENFGCEITRFLIEKVPKKCNSWYHCSECGTKIPMIPGDD